jgi:hypothetical protein
VKDDKLIYCGKKTLQKLWRVSLRDICSIHGLKEGQRVKVWIEIIEDEK